MPESPHLPAALLNAIRANPDDAGRWFDLASWSWDSRRDDEAVVVRVLWRTLRDNLAHASLEATLSEVKRNATRLARLARRIEGRADDTPRE
jgi:hypothetical protein